MDARKLAAKKLVVVAVLAVFCIGAVALALGGFGGGLTKKVIGIWHYNKTPVGSRTRIARDYFLEIGETTILHDGPDEQNKYAAVLEEKDGKVLVKNMDARTLYTIAIVDSDSIEIAFAGFGGKMTMTRSSAEARAEGLEKNKEADEADKTAKEAAEEENRRKFNERFGINRSHAPKDNYAPTPLY